LDPRLDTTTSGGLQTFQTWRRLETGSLLAPPSVTPPPPAPRSPLISPRPQQPPTLRPGPPARRRPPLSPTSSAPSRARRGLLLQWWGTAGAAAACTGTITSGCLSPCKVSSSYLKARVSHTVPRRSGSDQKIRALKNSWSRNSALIAFKGSFQNSHHDPNGPFLRFAWPWLGKNWLGMI